MNRDASGILGSLVQFTANVSFTGQNFKQLQPLKDLHSMLMASAKSSDLDCMQPAVIQT